MNAGIRFTIRSIICGQRPRCSECLTPNFQLRDVPATACRQVDVQDSHKWGQHKLISDHDWLEHHAKYFSSAALMPASMVRRVYDETEVAKYMQTHDGKEIEMDFVFALMAAFRVSAQSAGIRIRQLGLDFASFKAKHPEWFQAKKAAFSVSFESMG